MKLSGVINQEHLSPYAAAIIFRRIIEAEAAIEIVPEYKGEITPEIAVRMSEICTSKQDDEIIIFVPPAYWLVRQAIFDGEVILTDGQRQRMIDLENKLFYGGEWTKENAAELARLTRIDEAQR